LSSARRAVKIDIVIRKMTREDLATVSRLEKEIFSDPWPARSFTEILDDEQWGALVAELDGDIVGYACYMAVLDEAHLANIATAPLHRRKSVAKQLLERILDIVIDLKCGILLLEVRPSNHEAIDFYRKYGFVDLYRRPNYYRRPVEDALIMVRYLDTE